MSYRGLYINLDRSTDRRAAMESELARYNLASRYRRFSGVEGNPAKIRSNLNPGEIGCFLSHIAALQEGMQQNGHLHIVEDDTVFAACTAPVLDWAMKHGGGDGFDLLYTDIAMPLNNDSYRLFKSHYDRAVTKNASGGIEKVEFSVLDLKEIPFLAASSYLVNQQGMPKLMALYQEELRQGLRVPVDLFFRMQAEIGALKAGCVFPFITSVKVEDTLTSTIRAHPDTSRKFTAANIGRYSFFVGCDWAEVERLMHMHIPSPSTDDQHTTLLTRLLGFSLTI